MILIIDNYDSFTYNLVQYLSELGAEVEVWRNDATEVEALLDAHPDPNVHRQQDGISPPPPLLIAAGAGASTLVGVRTVDGGSGFCSQSAYGAHFGLGAAIAGGADFDADDLAGVLDLDGAAATGASRRACSVIHLFDYANAYSKSSTDCLSSAFWLGCCGGRPVARDEPENPD